MYTANGTLDKSQYVTKFAPLVKKVAYHMMAKLPPSVQVDDLIQVGMIGLLDAISNFDGTQGAQFETYAVQRIRGATARRVAPLGLVATLGTQEHAPDRSSHERPGTTT